MEFIFSDPSQEKRKALRHGIECLSRSVVVDFTGNVEVRYDIDYRSEKPKIILTPRDTPILSISRVPKSDLEAHFVHEEIGDYTELSIPIPREFYSQTYRIYHRPQTDG